MNKTAAFLFGTALGVVLGVVLAAIGLRHWADDSARAAIISGFAQELNRNQPGSGDVFTKGAEEAIQRNREIERRRGAHLGTSGD